MDMKDVERRGLVIVGCGKMGSAMLKGWLANGLPPGSVWVVAPRPSDWLRSIDGLNLNAELPADPAIVLLGVKPQKMPEVLPDLARFGGGATLFLTVAVGLKIASYEAVLGAETPLVRAMPNTPSAVGHGVTAIIGNGAAGADHVDLADSLLQAVGQVVRLEAEDQMDAVSAVSGSGPAYVFHLIETLAAAGAAHGLSPELSMALARATVAGAGILAEQSEETPEQLRVNVTSPNGTTQAALGVLMDEARGFPALLPEAVAAAIARAEELAK